MRTTGWLGLLLFLCTSAVGCKGCEDNLNATPGNLKGQFCDPETGVGLGRVEVSVQKPDGTPVTGKTTTGDSTGHFNLLNLEPGSYKVLGTLGPLTRTQDVVIQSDKNTEFVDSGCHEPPPPPPPTGGSVTGRACDDGVGAWVDFGQVWLSSPGNAGDVRYPGLTDVEGHYEIINVAPATYDLHIVKNAFSQDVLAVVVTEGQQTTVAGPATCAPPALGSVEGNICQDGQGWLDAARAYINLSGGQLLEATTDANGHFRIDNVPPGNQVVRVEKGVFSRSFAVTVASGSVTQVPSPATCDVTPPPPMTGTVTGRVCAPDGHTWLAGATVYVGDAANPTSQTQTDADGNFTLTGVPAGSQTVHVVKNSFTATYTVTVTASGTTAIPVNMCQVVPTATRVAVVSGLYDNVRCVLTGQTDPLASRPNDPCSIPGLGLDPANVTTVDGLSNTWASTFLGDYARMSSFDIIFFNCGVKDQLATVGPNAATYTANLRQFVESGHSIYASDWAAPLIEAAFPEFITWNKVNVATNNVEQAKVGNGPQLVTGNVVDPGIRAALGQSTIQVSFDLIAWVAMYSTAPATRVYFRGDAQSVSFFGPGPTMSNIPLTVGFDVGQGRVVYTSFHQERNLTPDMQAVLNLLVFEL